MKEFKDYYLLNCKQGSPDWHYLRKGRITASNLGTIMSIMGVCERAPYCTETAEEKAQILVGNKKEEHTKEAKERMQLGNDYEDVVRQHLSEYLKCEIKETGFAIFKKYPYLGCSPDGLIERPGKPTIGVEIKSPRRMYKPLLKYMDKKEEDRNKNDYSHIWKSHYLQMQMNMNIMGMEEMIYAVYGIDDKEIFIQSVKVDKEYWNDVIIPTVTEYYEKYMKPLVSEENKKRIEMNK